jgi:undecaprenyl-diphosphatase
VVAAVTPAPSAAHAAILGLVHGPAELLPISSSAHTTLVPWLARWPEARMRADAAKTLQVALHAGTLIGQIARDRRELRRSLASIDGRRAALIAAATLPAAACGLVLEGPIERRLGTPRAIAVGLLGGGAAMALADARGGQARTAADAGVADGLALGLAQAAALAPGVSRSGATLAAARALGFARRDAALLSSQISFPVIAGAVALKTRRLLSARRADQRHGPLAAGAAAALLSALVCPRPQAGARLLPYAAYRAALAGVVVGRR